MIQRSGQFNRMSFFTHIEALKQKILAEGGPRAAIIVPVLEQLQADINDWTVSTRFKRAYGSRLIREMEAAGYKARGF